MAAKKFDQKRFLIAWLRRGSYRTPVRQEVKKRARITRGLYGCEKCGASLRNGEYAIDHIQPVIHPKRGFVSWDEFINRLYTDSSGQQLLCHPCHDAKTKKENKKRK